jgi:3-dehydroquinate synthase
MCLAAQFSARLGWISDTDVTRIRALIEKMALPTRIPKGFTVERMLELMQVDKKVQAGKLRLVLLQGLGEAIITAQYDPQLLRELLRNNYTPR